MAAVSDEAVKANESTPLCQLQTTDSRIFDSLPSSVSSVPTHVQASHLKQRLRERRIAPHELDNAKSLLLATAMVRDPRAITSRAGSREIGGVRPVVTAVPLDYLYLVGHRDADALPRRAQSPCFSSAWPRAIRSLFQERSADAPRRRDRE
jgi:hypothetical protein